MGSSTTLLAARVKLRPIVMTSCLRLRRARSRSPPAGAGAQTAIGTGVLGGSSGTFAASALHSAQLRRDVSFGRSGRRARAGAGGDDARIRHDGGGEEDEKRDLDPLSRRPRRLLADARLSAAPMRRCGDLPSPAGDGAVAANRLAGVPRRRAPPCGRRTGTRDSRDLRIAALNVEKVAASCLQRRAEPRLRFGGRRRRRIPRR